MTEPIDTQQDRINAKIEDVQREYGKGIRDLLKEMNRSRLKNKGQVTQVPIVDKNNLRWTLSWKVEQVSYSMSVVIGIEDDGYEARAGRVWVHRHASTPVDFEGHTPTTRMRRLTHLSLEEIREAVVAEWI